MANKIQSADAIRRLAIQYQAMVEAADLLESIGSLEQASKEAEKAASAARENLKIAEEELASVKAETKKAKAKGDDVIALAVGAGNEKLEQADLEAKAIVAAANEQADLIVAKARKDADAITSGVESRRTAIAADVDALTKRADLMTAVIADKTAEVNDLELRLAKAQAQIAKILG